MPSQDVIDQQRALLDNYRRRLAYRLRQQAQLGVNVAPEVMFDIEDARANIRRIKSILRSLSAPVEDHPDDGDLRTPSVDGNSQGIEADQSRERIDGRTTYLIKLKNDVDDRLNAATDWAQFIDLQLIKLPGMTWTSEGNSSDTAVEIFNSFDRAFEACNRRILLLGASGMGKTTTLLRTAQKLILEAQADENAPVPLLSDLSKWKDKTVSTRYRRLPIARSRTSSQTYSATASIKNWLISNLQEDGVPEEIARLWVDNGCVALLLDGLDEVDHPDHRTSLIEAINGYIGEKRYFKIPVVISSRSSVYERRNGKQETWLVVDGVVELQPLTDQQINDCLSVPKATALRKAVPNEADFNDLARAPLTLSMLTQVYHILRPDALLATRPPAECQHPITQRRYVLFNDYIKSMLQQKDQRRQNNEKKLRIRYSREQTERYLDWLATCLIERSRTTFQLGDLYGFLAEKRSWKPWDVLNVTDAVAIFVFVTLLAWLVGAQTAQGLVPVPLLAIFIGIVAPSAYWFLLVLDKLTGTKVLGAWPERLLLGIILSLWGMSFIVFLLGFVHILHGSTAWPFGLPLSGTLAGVLCLVFVSFSVGEFRNRKKPLNIGLLVEDLFMILFAALLLGLVGGVLGTLGGFLSLVLLDTIDDALGLLGGALFIGISAVILGVNGVELSLIYTLVIILGTFLGGVLGGALGGILGGTLSVGLMIICMDSPKLTLISHGIKRILLNPIVYLLLVLYHYIPFNLKGFLEYVIDALLLKRSDNDYEFAHRLLRDHFALHGRKANDYDLYIQVGTQKSDLRDYPAALDAFNRAIDINRRRGEAFIGRGETYRLMAEYEQALQDLNCALGLGPQNAWALANRGETYRLMAEYEQALVDLNRAIELDPQYAWALASRGTTYRLMAEYEKALEDLNRAIELDPQNVWTLTVRGGINRVIANHEKALADLSHALELDPKSLDVLTERGSTYCLIGEYEQALVDLNRAIELDRESPVAFTRRGETYRLMMDYERALADLNRAVDLNTRLDWLRYNRALTYLKLNQPEEAQTDLSAAIEIAQQFYNSNPRNWENNFNLALYYLALENNTEAEHLYEEAIFLGASPSNIREAVQDLDTFLTHFSSHTQARTIRMKLWTYLQEHHPGGL